MFNVKISRFYQNIRLFYKNSLAIVVILFLPLFGTKKGDNWW